MSAWIPAIPPSLSRSLSLSFLLLPLWNIGHPWNPLLHFSFLIIRQSVGLLGRGISTSQGRYLHKHRINADIHVWSAIRTHDLSVRTSEDSSCLRPRGPCDYPPANRTNVFRDFSSQYLQKNSWIVPQIRQHRFLQHPLQFTLHSSSYSKFVSILDITMY
jgi:hypothetical protein